MAEALLSMRRYQQMYVGGHEDIGMRIAGMFGASLFEFVQIKSIIFVCAEDGLVIVTSHNDVLGLARNHKARETSHSRLP